MIIILIGLFCLIEYNKNSEEDPDYDSYGLAAMPILCLRGCFSLLFLAGNIIGLVYSVKLFKQRENEYVLDIYQYLAEQLLKVNNFKLIPLSSEIFLISTSRIQYHK